MNVLSDKENFEEMRRRYQNDLMKCAKNRPHLYPTTSSGLPLREAGQTVLTSPEKGIENTVQSPQNSEANGVHKTFIPPFPLEKEDVAALKKKAEEIISDSVPNRETEVSCPEKERPSQPLQTVPVIAPISYETKSDYPVREQEEWETEQASIMVQAYTAREGLPVPNADVTISRIFEGRSVLHFFMRTNISGETPVISVPAPPKENSQMPHQPHPYASYIIQVDCPGYYIVENINVPVFGGVESIQPVEMVPIPERDSTTFEKLVRESEPADL